MRTNPSRETNDTILGGALTLVQPLSGYRFSIDSILLGHFARPRTSDRVLELGAGCGVVSIMLAALDHPREVVAIELQHELATIVSRNAASNGLASVTSVCADLRARSIDGVAPAWFGYVVANPPYRAPQRGRESPNLSRRIARGAGGADLRDFITAASRYAAHSAKVAVVFTASRTAELLAELKAQSLEPKRIRFVHPRQGMRASTILVEARKGGGVEAEVEPPLFLYANRGVYSDEARELLSPPPTFNAPRFPRKTYSPPRKAMARRATSSGFSIGRK
jgi:tRNA1Val (adenine37-N6)-methyltransferase